MSSPCCSRRRLIFVEESGICRRRWPVAEVGGPGVGAVGVGGEVADGVAGSPVDPPLAPAEKVSTTSRAGAAVPDPDVVASTPVLDGWGY